MTGASYAGFYINLDRDIRRRREIEEQLQIYGLSDRYARVAAADGDTLHAPKARIAPGEVGCFQSHYLGLIQARAKGITAHILEDDVFLSEYLDLFPAHAMASGLLDTFDIIFTETFLHPSPFTLRFLKEAVDLAIDENGSPRPNFNIQMIDLSTWSLTCTTSYFVSAKSIDRILQVLKAELDAGPTMPIDFCYRKAAETGRLRIGCTVPFLTGVRLEYIAGSSITGRYDPKTSFDLALQGLLRYSFFIKRDLRGYAARYFREIVGAQMNPDEHHKLLVDIIGAIMLGAPSVR